MRLDQYLVLKNLVPSRTKAKELIEMGQVLVEVNGKWVVKKSASYQVVEGTARVKLAENEILRYVSRSGLKLEGALNHLGLKVIGQKAVDIGQSTGGFTHCLLEAGASFVAGVDVGRDQLDENIKNHDQVAYFEGLNARDIDALGMVKEKGPFDICVMDLSFISMTKILNSAHFLLAPKGLLLSLVKPQFELDQKSLNKKGLVKDEALYDQVEQNIRQATQAAGFEVLEFFQSSLKGRDGNQEFFIYAKKSS